MLDQAAILIVIKCWSAYVCYVYSKSYNKLKLITTSRLNSLEDLDNFACACVCVWTCACVSSNTRLKKREQKNQKCSQLRKCQFCYKSALYCYKSGLLLQKLPAFITSWLQKCLFLWLSLLLSLFRFMTEQLLLIFHCKF